MGCWVVDRIRLVAQCRRPIRRQRSRRACRGTRTIAPSPAPGPPRRSCTGAVSGSSTRRPPSRTRSRRWRHRSAHRRHGGPSMLNSRTRAFAVSPSAATWTTGWYCSVVEQLALVQALRPEELQRTGAPAACPRRRRAAPARWCHRPRTGPRRHPTASGRSSSRTRSAGTRWRVHRRAASSRVASSASVAVAAGGAATSRADTPGLPVTGFS